nr:oligomeric golgi complex subunit 5 [Hymenolepis microstoma]
MTYPSNICVKIPYNEMDPEIRLESTISSHVSKYNNELLSQTAELENFSNIVASVESRIMGISGNVNMIKQRLGKHYEQLNSQVTLIRRLGVVYETLRSILRVSSIVKKLRDSSVSIVQASECIEELNCTFETLDWKGIQVLEENFKIFSVEKERVTTEAWELIHTSFKNNDQSHLGLALQAFNNLSMLPKVIQGLVSDWQKDVENVVKIAADVEDLNKRAKGKVISSLSSSTPGKASLPASGGQAAAFRNLLWTGLDQMVTTLDRCLSQARMLIDTLRKIRSGSGSLAIHLRNYILANITIPEERDCCAAMILVLSTGNEETPMIGNIRKLALEVDSYMFEAYSEGLLGWIVTCLTAIFEPALRRRSGQLKEALESDYPRLLKLFLNLSGNSQQTMLAKPLTTFLAPFEAAYLGRGLTRLFDRVNSTFVGVTASDLAGENLPRLIDAERLVQTVSTELAQSAAVQRELFCKVIRNVAKMIALFSTKVEALIVTSQVSVDGLPTPGQQKNAHLVNFTCAFVDHLRMAVARHTTAQQQKWRTRRKDADDPQAIVDQSIVSELSDVCLSALEPMLKAITDHVVEKYLPRIHLEISVNGEVDPPCVRDIQVFIHRMRTEYLTGFTTSSGSGTVSINRPTAPLFNSGEAALRFGLQTRVLSPCLDALAVHISLLRPSTTMEQRSHLTSCAGEIEMILSSLAPPSVHTEAAFARLRMLRQLFALPEEEILSAVKSKSSSMTANRGVIGLGSNVDSLPGSLILHHMISRAPVEIPMPYHQAARNDDQVAGWSVDRYVRWCLRQADEPARLTFITRAMDIYVEGVESRQQREYPEIYPFIRDLIEFYQQEVWDDRQETQ